MISVAAVHLKSQAVLVTGTKHQRRRFPAPASGSARRELIVTEIGAQGDGLADGVHVPLTLPGERLIAEVDSGRGRMVDVLASSPDRVAPACAHFGECGGCALQHWASEPYLAWKAGRIGAALARERLETEILAPIAAPPASRRRVALHARRVGREMVVGFKVRRSWTVIPIHECAVADPAIVAALPALGELADPLLEHPASAPTLRATMTLAGLDIEVTGVEQRGGGPSADARRRVADAAQAADFARVTLGGEILYQARAPSVRAGPAVVELPPGAFLQAVAEAEATMAAFSLQAAAGAHRIVDLFCGLGAFTFPLAAIAPVLAADVSSPAISALVRATGGVSGLKPITAIARDLDRRPLSAADLAGVDTVLFDPPRAGAEAQAREIARSAAARVIGVSCNPATFARDARILADAGFKLLRILPVDQFLWSPHIELVGIFSREPDRS